ncbi:putative leader peptide [Nonomuraea solani]|uniref:putative leader peptide n=1 Tax=Nonomuraea solani TaxID=1144553 RepID=UPI00389920FF
MEKLAQDRPQRVSQISDRESLDLGRRSLLQSGCQPIRTTYWPFLPVWPIERPHIDLCRLTGSLCH